MSEYLEDGSYGEPDSDSLTANSRSISTASSTASTTSASASAFLNAQRLFPEFVQALSDEHQGGSAAAAGRTPTTTPVLPRRSGENEDVYIDVSDIGVTPGDYADGADVPDQGSHKSDMPQLQESHLRRYFEKDEDEFVALGYAEGGTRPSSSSSSSYSSSRIVVVPNDNQEGGYLDDNSNLVGVATPGGYTGVPSGAGPRASMGGHLSSLPHLRPQTSSSRSGSASPSLQTFSPGYLNDDSDSDDDDVVGDFDVKPVDLTDVDDEGIEEASLDFNARYQKCIEEIAMIGPGTLMQTKVGLHKRLTSVARDFLYCAKGMVRLIVNELHLNDDEKTLRPRGLGGIAGGAKYIANGILFKVSTAAASSGLYQSDDEAAKVASHELVGLTLFSSAVRDGAARPDPDRVMRRLSVPLACVIDYRGHRVLAECLLPIGGDSLICGSADAGRSVKGLKEAPAPFGDLLRDAANKLNLLVHDVERANGPPVSVAGPADAELHRGRDGRAYVLDLSRMMPPCGNILEKKLDRRSSHLYELLRPEFVCRFNCPLSSDARSRFTVEAERERHNMIVQNATDQLIEKHIVRAGIAWAHHINDEWEEFIVGNPLTELLTRSRPASTISKEAFFSASCEWAVKMCHAVSRVVHGHGVNVRFAGLVYLWLASQSGNSLPSLPEFSHRDPVRPEIVALANEILLLELISRCCKIIHRRGMRALQRAFPNSVVEAPLLRGTERLLNFLLANSSKSKTKSKEFWEGVVAPLLNEKFFRFAHSSVWAELDRPNCGSIQQMPGGILLYCDGVPAVPDSQLRQYVLDSTLSVIRSQRSGLAKAEFGRVILYGRVVRMSGSKIDNHVVEDLESCDSKFFDRTRPFARGSAIRLSPIIKSSNIVESAQGYVAKIRGLNLLRKNRPQDARRLYCEAFRLFDRALQTDRGDQAALRNAGQTLEGLMKCVLQQRRNEGLLTPHDLPLSEKSELWPVALDAERFLVRAVEVNPNDSKTLQQLAMFGEFFMPDLVRFGSIAVKSLEKHESNKSAYNCLLRIIQKMEKRLPDAPELALFKERAQYFSTQDGSEE